MDDMQQKKPLLPDPPAIETKKLLSVLAGILLLTACMIFQRLYGGVEMLPFADVPFPEEIPSCQCSLGQEKESRYLTCCIRRSAPLRQRIHSPMEHTDRSQAACLIRALRQCGWK